MGVSSRVTLANVLNDDIVVSEFELQPSFYVHFPNHTQRKKC